MTYPLLVKQHQKKPHDVRLFIFYLNDFWATFQDHRLRTKQFAMKHHSAVILSIPTVLMETG